MKVLGHRGPRNATDLGELFHVPDLSTGHFTLFFRAQSLPAQNLITTLVSEADNRQVKGLRAGGTRLALGVTP